MKVKELMKKLQEFNPDAYVHIQTDKRFQEDITNIYDYDTENAEVVVLGNWLSK